LGNWEKCQRKGCLIFGFSLLNGKWHKCVWNSQTLLIPWGWSFPSNNKWRISEGSGGGGKSKIGGGGRHSQAAENCGIFWRPINAINWRKLFNKKKMAKAKAFFGIVNCC
jgi:hypothetical protein